MAATSTRTTRIEIRTHLKRARRIRYAAKLLQQSMSGFMLDAASERAEDVISAARTTVVPSKFFDELWNAMSGAARPNAALARQARVKRHVVQR